MIDRSSGATGGGGSVAADPAARAGQDLPEARPSIWGGQRSHAPAEGGPSSVDVAREPFSPPGEAEQGSMSAAVRRAREAARLEWLHRIPDDPNERQRIADDLRP